jgi:phenylacetate-coenzyme A ligase PaaK-like adenylate-forming protein
MNENYLQRILSIQTPEQFEQLALEAFQYQYTCNLVYKQFVDGLKVDAKQVKTLDKIPYLPISFFKTHRICTQTAEQIVFASSGTTGTLQSKHFVSDLNFYQESYLACFEKFYGNPEDYCVLALLPSYMEREGSSLIYMVDDLIKRSKHNQSGFFLHADEQLIRILKELEVLGQKTVLLGVSFALLDFAQSNKLKLSNCIIMETGGMKGRGKEMIREELHEILTTSFGVDTIHSEYGMTELLSQAYSAGSGLFYCPPWMRVEAREIEDPMSNPLLEKTGSMHIIDLANINSCCFIAAQDLCKVYRNNSFEVLGRFDNSDIRGCNLLL